MSFFTEELKKCTEGFEGIKCIGNAMYIPLGENNRLKIFFTTLGYADHYEALSISAIDKNNGVIDKNTIKFADVWGKKQVNNPNSFKVASPHMFGNMEMMSVGMCTLPPLVTWSCWLNKSVTMPSCS